MQSLDFHLVLPDHRVHVLGSSQCSRSPPAPQRFRNSRGKLLLLTTSRPFYPFPANVTSSQLSLKLKPLDHPRYPSPLATSGSDVTLNGSQTFLSSFRSSLGSFQGYFCNPYKESPYPSPIFFKSKPHFTGF